MEYKESNTTMTGQIKPPGADCAATPFRPGGAIPLHINGILLQDRMWMNIRIMPLMRNIIETLSKSATDDLRRFFADVGNCPAWFITTDYVYGDSFRMKDTIAIAIMPTYKDVSALRDNIQELVPHDLKSKSTLPDKFLKVLEKHKLFYFVFLFEKDFKLRVDGKDDRKEIADILGSWLKAITQLKITCQSKDSTVIYQKTETSISALLKKLNDPNKSGTVAKLRQLIVSLCLVSYLSSMLVHDCGAKHLLWCPDRDPIMGLSRGDYEAYFPQLFILLTWAMMALTKCEDAKEHEGVDVMMVTMPSSGKAWSDPFIRLADYFAGAFARFNEADVGEDKILHKLLREYVADNDCVAVIKCSSSQVSRLAFSKRNPCSVVGNVTSERMAGMIPGASAAK